MKTNYMVKMSNSTPESDSEEDTLTSSECSDSSDSESSEHDKDDTSDTASYRSLAFTVRKNRSTATVKSKKTKKRVRFKPGDSLVLIYVIPNREMLGLKSDSEESDYGESDEDSDDEEDDEDDEDDEEDGQEDDDDDSDDDDDDDEDNSKKNKNKTKTPKPFAKLLAVKQINRRKSLPDLRNNIKKPQEKVKPPNLDLNASQANLKKKQRLKNTRKDKKEKTKVTKKDSSESKPKQSKNKKSKFNAIKTDIDKFARNKKNRSRFLEIRATVESVSKNQDTNVPVPKLMCKQDTKPSVIDINSTAQLHSSKLLSNRTKLQPTSFRITKPRQHTEVSNNTNNLTERPASVAKVVSASYDSLTSVLPSSYVTFSSVQNNTVEETIKRLDPDSMNASGKRNYAWQIANGTISSQSLRTPSILPFWDSLQNSVTENNTLKLPT